MDAAQVEIETLCRRHGFMLVRQKKHKVFRDSRGRTFVMSKTPSDRRAWNKALAVLRRVIREQAVCAA